MQPAEDDRRKGDIADGQMLAGNETPASQGLVEDRHQRMRLGDSGLDGGTVALFRRGADKAMESCAVSCVEGCRLPVHPAIRQRTPAGIKRPERAFAMFRREIPHDRVGFPQHQIAVDQHRHQAVGVHGLVFGRLHNAEGTARIMARVR